MDIMIDETEAAMTDIEDIVNQIVHENIGNDEILITKNIIQDQDQVQLVQDNGQENHETSPPTIEQGGQGQVNNDNGNEYQNQNYAKPGPGQCQTIGETTETIGETIGESHNNSVNVDDVVVDNIVSDIILENENENEIQIQVKSSLDILEDHQTQKPEEKESENQNQSTETAFNTNTETINETAASNTESNNVGGGLICANCYCTINRKEDCRLFSQKLFLSTSTFNIKSTFNDENGTSGTNVTILDAILEIYESKWSVNFKTYKEYDEFTSHLYMCWNCLFILANLYKLFKEFQDISTCSNSLIEKYINLTTKLDDSDIQNKYFFKRPAEACSQDQDQEECGIKLVNVSSLAPVVGGPGQNGPCQSQDLRASTESGNSSCADQLFDDFQKFGGEDYDYDGSDNNISIDEKFIVQEELHQNQNPASTNNYFNSYNSSSNCTQNQKEGRNLRNRNVKISTSNTAQDSYSHFMDIDQNSYQDPYGELNNIMGGSSIGSSSSKVENNDQSNKKGNNSNSNPNRYDDQQPGTSTSQGTGQRRGRGRPRKEPAPVKPPPKPRNEGSDEDRDPDFTISSDSEEVKSDDDDDSEWSESGSYKSKNSSTKRKGGKRRRTSSTEKKFIPPLGRPVGRPVGSGGGLKKARSITFTQEEIFNRPGIFLPRKYQKHPPLKIEPQLNMANNQVKLFHLQQVKQLLNNRSQVSLLKSSQGQVGKAAAATRLHRYNCKSPNCTSVFESYMSLQEHIKLEDVKFPNRCKYCFWPYKTLQSKDTHERKYHTNINTIACEFCKQYFVKIEEIFLHLDSTHRYSSGEYYCSICSLYYQRGWSLLMHFMAPSHRQQENLLEASVNKIEVTPTIVNNNFVSQVPPTNITVNSDLNYFGNTNTNITNTNTNQMSSSSWMNIPQLKSTHSTIRRPTSQPSSTMSTIGKNKKIIPDSSISITPIMYQNQTQNQNNFNPNKSITITSTAGNNSQSLSSTTSGQNLPLYQQQHESEESPMEMQTLIKKIQMDMEAKKWTCIPDLKPLPPDS